MDFRLLHESILLFLRTNTLQQQWFSLMSPKQTFRCFCSSAAMALTKQTTKVPPVLPTMANYKKLHAHLIVTGLEKDPSAMAKVLSSYAVSAANLDDAHLVFERIEEPTSFIWNSMIRGAAQSNRPEEAIHFFNQMRQRGVQLDKFTFIFALKACSRSSEVIEGKKIHGHVLKLGFGSYVLIQNVMIYMYGCCNDTVFARQVFDEMSERDLVSWNSLISGYSHNNQLSEVLGLFKQMQAENVKADEVTMVKVVSACTHLGDWESAMFMVDYIEKNYVKMDLYLSNTLIDMYGRRGSVDFARRVFDKMSERNIMSWNAMVTTYAKAGDLITARKLFDDMPERDLISWTSMIAGYSQASQFSEALTLFRKMQEAKVKPDEITIVSVISACAHLGALDLGRWLHNYIREHNIKSDVYVGNALIDMYCKCGCTEKALEVFGEMGKKDTLSWNSIILGLATGGHAKDALEFFSRMLLEGFRPNDVTFIGVLLACSHKGLVHQGLEYFESMSKVYQLEPRMKHYGCMVDLLSRSGNLDMAYKFILKMPVEPDPIVWRTLLGACTVHGNVGLAEIATNKLLELEPGNSGNYVLLSNIYAGADRWNDAMKVREMMEEHDVQKPPGCSSIEVNGMMREYVAA